MDEDGFLSITGRKKELLVLSNGKKVVPSHIEGLLVSGQLIDQACVIGEGKPYLTALLVPNWANLGRALKAQGKEFSVENPERSIQNPMVRDFLQQHIDMSLRDVANWEQVRKFALLPHPFTLASDELTVSLKLRRTVVLAKHFALVDSLYRD
jgi:long-chain acyl-CoA synthetase